MIIASNPRTMNGNMLKMMEMIKNNKIWHKLKLKLKNSIWVVKYEKGFLRQTKKHESW